MTLKPGTKAPSFSLKDQSGKTRTLASFKGRKLVVFFYPKDDTPGCTLESKDFSAMRGEIEAAGAAVLGISGGDERSKAKFCDKHGIEIPMLADPDFETSKSYGAFGEKSFMGRKFKGIKRTTFLIDEKGKVAGVFENVKAAGHAKEVLAALRGDGEERPAKKRASAKRTPAKKK